jgi:hypothetical protein
VAPELDTGVPEETVPPADVDTPDDLEVSVPDAEGTVRTRRIALFSVLAAPVIANFVAIFGFVNFQPQIKSSGLATILRAGVVPGQAYIDPNVGYNSYAVGHVAAMSWLHGAVPWWNFNEGLGTPLAGSIQSASFFPLTLTLALGDGSLWFHLGLELLIGLATFFLLRELRCSPFAAAAGAIAFELNGSVAWLTNAPVNPVPFLPVLILGIEWIVNAVGLRRRGGWILLAIGVWLTIVSGFPEVAAMNAALATGWLVFRLLQRRGVAVRVLARAALGGVVGVLLAAPLLNAFVRAYRTGDLGTHTQPLATLSLPRVGLAQLVSPYFYGGIFDSTNTTVTELWGRVGGYTWVVLLVLAIGGIFGKRERAMRLLLAAWAVVFLGYIYDVPVLHQLVENLPGLTHIAVFRYVTSSVLFCLCVLAALCLDDLRALTSKALVRRVVPGLAVVVALFVIGFFSTPAARHWTHLYLPKWYWGSLVILGGTLLGIAVVVVVAIRLGRGRGGRIACVALGAILAFEAFGFFEVPILAYPRQVVYDTSVVSFLRANLGYQRFYTIGPVSPNYGAFYGISSLDESDLPVPKVWAHFVHTQLNPCILPWQLGNGSPTTGCEPAIFEFVAHAPTYEAAGVKYFLLGERHSLSTFEQPSYGAGPRTPDGAATMVMKLRAPGFWPGGIISAFTVQVSGSVPPGMTTTACSASGCATAVPEISSPGTVTFELRRLLQLTGELTITMHASYADNIALYTAPSSTAIPSTVSSNGSVLEDRSAILKYTYVASSLPKLVNVSSVAKVYELKNTSPIATAPGCAVHQESKTDFTVNCARASTLLYRELSYPGWRATVHGRAAAITTVNGVYQSVAVPEGESAVSFSYAPPLAPLAWAAALIGVLAIAVSLVRRRVDFALPFSPKLGALGDPPDVGVAGSSGTGSSGTGSSGGGAPEQPPSPPTASAT